MKGPGFGRGPSCVLALEVVRDQIPRTFAFIAENSASSMRPCSLSAASFCSSARDVDRSSRGGRRGCRRLLRGLRGQRRLHLRVDLRLLGRGGLLGLVRVCLRRVLRGLRSRLLLAGLLLLLVPADGTGGAGDDRGGRRDPHQAGSSTSHDLPSLVIVVG